MNLFSDFLPTLIHSTNYSVLPLAGDASSRRYYRVIDGKNSWVLMEWEPFKEIADFPFLSVQKYFFDNNIRVPQIYNYSKELGLFLLEDLGDLTLERRFWEFQNQDVILPFYKKTLDQLIKIHSLSFDDTTERKCTAYKVEFSVEKLLWEMNYAKKNLLQDLLKINLTDKIDSQLSKEFVALCETLYSSPQVICHRDFHSRNVMLSYNDLVIIDFQDARLGPPVYDLVSLFCDSYVELNDTSVKILMDYYKENFPHFKKLNLSNSQWDHFYDLQTIQRCFKACGSFASFKIMRNDSRYLNYIAPTLKLILKKLKQINSCPTLESIIEENQAQWEEI
jgi:N-acetylmuramate 1-kinase